MCGVEEKPFLPITPSLTLKQLMQEIFKVPNSQCECSVPPFDWLCHSQHIQPSAGEGDDTYIMVRIYDIFGIILKYL